MMIAYVLAKIMFISGLVKKELGENSKKNKINLQRIGPCAPLYIFRYTNFIGYNNIYTIP